MTKQPRLSPVLVALSLFIASGPLPAAAQVRVQVGQTAGGIPAVSPIGASSLNGAGLPSNALSSGLGLNGALSAPSAAPTPLTTVLPVSAYSQSPALIAGPSAAATPDKAQAVVIRTPGGAATGVADGGLVDEHPRVRQREALARRAGGEDGDDGDG